MPATSVVGLDTAKNVFQVHGVDSSGKITLRKRLRRGQLTDFFANLPVCIIGLEATQGAHHWARVLGTFGHTVRLIAPQFVKPYLQSQKNDANDAAAICASATSPSVALSLPKPLRSLTSQPYPECSSTAHPGPPKLPGKLMVIGGWSSESPAAIPCARALRSKSRANRQDLSECSHWLRALEVRLGVDVKRSWQHAIADVRGSK